MEHFAQSDGERLPAVGSMKQADLKSMTLDDLVDRFAEIGIAQDNALWDGKYAKFNRLYGEMDDIDRELKSRGTNARLALLRLYNHPNMQVRLKAAVRTLAVVPETARHALQAIVDSKIYPQAADANSLLRGLNDGSFHPD